MKFLHSGLRFAIPACLALAGAGCATSEKFTLNNVSLSGPVARAPVNVTIDPVPGSFQVIPGFALGDAPVIRGSIDPAVTTGWFVDHTPSSSPKGNLTWDVPGNEYSLDLQFTATHHFALTAGGTYAAVAGYQFTNFRGGIGFFTVGNDVGFRLDAGVQFNGVRYRSRATVTTVYDFLGSSKQYITNFDDSGTEQSMGASFGLTINTAYTESLVNGFLNIGVAYEPVLDYSPTRFDSLAGPGDSHATASNVKSTTAVLSFGGGIALELGRGNRAIIGMRGAQLLDVNSPAPRPIWQPFIQFVFSL